MGSLNNVRAWEVGEEGGCGASERGERGVVTGIDVVRGGGRLTGIREAHKSGTFDDECPAACLSQE